MRKFSIYIYTQYIFKGCDDSYKVDDGYCDDENNNPGCNYDGGDCCGANVNTLYFSECLCIDPDGSTPSPSSTTTYTGPTTSGIFNFPFGI